MYIYIYASHSVCTFSIYVVHVHTCVYFVYYSSTACSSNSNASYEVGGALPLSKDSSMSMDEKGSSVSEEDDKPAVTRCVCECVCRGDWCVHPCIYMYVLVGVCA